jgi:tetrahydromethanopterin S-methyltransferase subunit H
MIMAADRGNQTASGLFVYGAEQKTYEVGNIRLGGQPGAQPTALIGSIFYHGHEVFTDEDRDQFDTQAVLKLIHEQEDFSQRTGNPCLLDVVGATPEAVVRHLEYVAEVTDMPLLIDGTTSDVRMAGLEFVAKAGLADRIVYNSIQPEIDDEELHAIGQAGVTCAIVLTYNMMDFTTEGRIDSVRKLLPKLEKAGITKPIVDTCVLDMATLGQALSAIHIVKDEFGLPAGGGVHNAVAIWRGLKEKMGKQAQAPCLAACVAISVASGADFALYGPVEDANIVYPAVAMTDTALSQIAMDRGHKLDKETHPRFRIG